MYLSSETKHTIVSVRCGETQGTAFLVSPGYFMTARHVVLNYLYHKAPIYITYKGIVYKADSAKGVLENRDVAVIIAGKLAPFIVINSKEELCPLVPIPVEHLLGEYFTIIGFPNEIGNGIDQVEQKIRGEMKVTKKAYDIVTSRIGNFNFNHNNGLSGSPIINERNVIVGIAVVEIGNKLAFVSIDSVKKQLKNYQIPVVTNYLKYDTSTSGRAGCIEIFENAKILAGRRYQESMHIQSKAFERAVHDFISEKVMESRAARMMSIETAILNRISSHQYHSSIYKEGDYDNLIEATRFWINDSSNSDCKEFLNRSLRSLQNIYSQYAYSHSKFMYIVGNAGSGKTHLSCGITGSLLDRRNVYLFFGSQFKSTEGAFNQVKELLHLNKDEIRKLDDRSDKHTLIIIDALNEGAGERYWQGELPRLVSEFESFNHIKLLVTIRKPFDDIVLSEMQRDRYPSYEITGYSYVSEKKAVSSYFDKYNVDIKYADLYKSEFKNPLFLIIFCAAYRNMSPVDRDNINYVRLFELYLEECNKIISEKVDEDVHRGITTTAMKTIAAEVVSNHYAGLIPRNDARTVTEGLCPNRLWSRHLLKALLDEDLLMTSLTDDKVEDALMFGYEKMGDFLKADYLVNSDKTDKEIFDLLANINAYYEENANTNRSKFDNMIAALIAVWGGPKRNRSLTDCDEFGEIMFAKNIQAALRYDKERNIIAIRNWMKRSEDLSDSRTAINSANAKNKSELLAWHQKMLGGTITSRDDSWTVSVNNLFNNPKTYTLILNKAAEPVKDYRLLIVLSWMMTTSYPQAHHFLSNVLMRQFTYQPSYIKEILELFKSVDDPYVHHGLLEAIYGVALLNQDVETLRAIAKCIYNTYFFRKGYAPNDILVRYWALKILERVNSVVDCPYWHYAQPPYKSELQKIKKSISRDDFGKSAGMSRMFYTLSNDSDFHRYVLHSNNYSDTEDFIRFDENGKESGIAIAEVADMMKSLILDKYRLEPHADLFDQEKLSGNDRMTNYKERIGKKYVWLALYEVYATFCDNYVMRLKGKDFSDYLPDVNYPWYSRVLPVIDPTLMSDTEIRKQLDVKIEMKHEGNALNPLLECEDQNGDLWIQLIAFERKNIVKDGRLAEITFFTNGLLADNSQDIDRWASNFDFTGRRMPEPEDNWHCIWNEYPWSDAYKSNVEYKFYDKKVVPFNFIPSYANMLQEEKMGVLGPFESSNAYAPCVELMDFLELHTAERGIVRDYGGAIVALNRNLYMDGQDGLFIKKERLLDFLKAKKLSLYICALSTGFFKKEDEGMSYEVLPDMSGCWKLYSTGEWVTLQEMRVPANVK